MCHTTGVDGADQNPTTPPSTLMLGGWLTTICDSIPGDLMPSSDLLGHWACMWCTDIHVGKTPTSIKKLKFKLENVIETDYTHYTKEWHKQTMSILSCDPCHLGGVPRRQISTFFLCTEILRIMTSSFNIPSGMGLSV